MPVSNFTSRLRDHSVISSSFLLKSDILLLTQRPCAVAPESNVEQPVSTASNILDVEHGWRRQDLLTCKAFLHREVGLPSRLVSSYFALCQTATCDLFPVQSALSRKKSTTRTISYTSNESSYLSSRIPSYISGGFGRICL